MTNPYIARTGLPDARMFVGRETEQERILALLGAAKPSSVAILGPTRIGKTTLLERVLQRCQANLQPAVPCAIVPPVVIKDKDSAFRSLAKALAQALGPGRTVETAAFSVDGFQDWLRDVVGDTKALVFLDDFDDWSFPSDEMRSDVYNVLRAAMWQQRLGFCLTTRHVLQDLCTADGRMLSLLWNVFTTVELGLLTRQEAKNLIHGPHAEAGLPVTDDEWDLVFAEAGPHPCLTQVAGYQLFEAKQKAKGELTQEDLYFLQQQVHREVAAYFPVLLNYLREREPALVTAAGNLARGEPVSREDGLRLTALGLAYPTARGVRLLSKAFEEFLAQAGAPATAGTGQPAPAHPEPARKKAPAQVFLCHASADRAFAGRLCHDLFDAGIDVWVDWLSIAPGSMFDRAIENALYACSFVILVVTPDAVASDYVRSEVEWALDNRRTVIPVISRAAKLPPRWHGLHNCDATTDQHYHRALVQLVGMLPRRQFGPS